jgi:hypothetical protein
VAPKLLGIHIVKEEKFLKILDKQKKLALLPTSRWTLNSRQRLGILILGLSSRIKMNQPTPPSRP